MRDRARLTVLKPGWLTTIQDFGRHGLQHCGMPVAGAMDRPALVLANRLVGNPDQAAALECTVKGPELRCDTDVVLAVTGADLSAAIDGHTIPLWTTVAAAAGSRITFGARRSGARTYLAIAGGFDVPVVLGSRSTHLPSGTGGFDGRRLAVGDRLVGGEGSSPAQATMGRSVPESARAFYRKSGPLRILPGPQLDRFVPGALDALTSGPYRLTEQSDRMGYRLEGPSLSHRPGLKWISDGTVMGAVQIVPDGQPILLMADCQTAGGYPKAAIVITADLPRAAQLLPGDFVSFQLTTLKEAQAVWKARWDTFNQALPPHPSIRRQI